MTTYIVHSWHLVCTNGISEDELGRGVVLMSVVTLVPGCFFNRLHIVFVHFHKSKSVMNTRIGHEHAHSSNSPASIINWSR